MLSLTVMNAGIDPVIDPVMCLVPLVALHSFLFSMYQKHLRLVSLISVPPQIVFVRSYEKLIKIFILYRFFFCVKLFFDMLTYLTIDSVDEGLDL